MIGTDITGTVPLGNAADGIDLFDESRQHGRRDDRRRGQRHLGQRPATGSAPVPSSANNNLVEGNFIGTDATGTKDLGNGGDGVYVQDSEQHDRRDGGRGRQRHRLQRPGRRGGGGQLQRPDDRGGDPVEFDLRQPGAGDRPGRRRRHAQPSGRADPGAQ